MSNERVTLEGVKRIVAVASGKGGVGKSTVSVNLALALAGLGYKVGLFDGDVHGPNIPLMLGARRQEKAEGYKDYVAVAMSRDYEKETRKGPPLERFGLKVMSTGLLVGEEQPIIPDTNLIGRMIMQMIRSIDWGELDYLLIDLPPGTGEPQITLSQELQIDGVVLVTTPPDVSLLDTTKALNLYRERGIAVLGLVENMSFYICPVCSDQREIFPRSEREAERSLKAENITILGRIPLNPAVGTAGDNGRPLVITEPASEVTLAFIETARQVVKAIEALPVPAEEKSSPGKAVRRFFRARPKPTPFNIPEPSPPAPLPRFESSFLDELAGNLLSAVQQKLTPQAASLKRDEAGMRAVVEAYQAAWDELNCQTPDDHLPAALQKELMVFLLAQILPE